MGKRITSVPIRLDIVGLEPRLFDLCKRSRLAIIEARSKGSVVSSSDAHRESESSVDRELVAVPKDQLEAYNKLVATAIDFERAYGRNVSVRIFERSQNKFVNLLFFGRRREPGSSPEMMLRPTFYVNGVKVFVGIPKSFSELDESVDRVFGRKSPNRKDLV
jgi:hypothetical protein